MTVAELYSQVASLGFAESLESDKIFYDTAARALFDVNRVRPRTASVLINHISPENLIDDVFKPEYVKGELSFTATSPRCAYFEYNGRGRVFFETMGEDGDFEIFYERELPGESDDFAEFKAILEKKDGPVRMRIVGDYVFSVRNAAMYAELWGPAEKDVPKRANYTSYDIKSIVNDFVELNAPPIAETEEYANPAGDYRVEEGSKLLLPHDKPGVYKVIYKRTPRAINTEDSPMSSAEKIDLDEDVAALMAPLIAAYVFAEDEPSLSEYYLSLYRQGAAEIRASARSSSVVKVKSTNGW